MSVRTHSLTQYCFHANLMQISSGSSLIRAKLGLHDLR